jgi:membrane AbrB-like protein
MTLFHLLLTLAVGAVGGIIATKLKIPGGLMVGAIITVAVLNIFSGTAFLPHESKTIIQIISGAFIGCTMEKSDLRRLPYIIKPACIMLIGFLTLNLLAGFLIWKTSHLDLITSLMSVVPGGISDTPIVAEDMGADGPKVAVMQVVRQILGISVFPSLILFYDNHKKKHPSDVDIEGYKEKRVKSKTKSGPALLCTLAVASIFGFLGKVSGIPAGTFVFAIISVLLLKLIFNFAHLPRWIRKCAQILSGCYLGSIVGMSDVLELRFLLLPLIIIIIGYMLNCFFTGTIIKKTCRFTRKESLLITTPAGASDMALISSDMGVENTDIIILQVLRAVIVMALFPQIMRFIEMILN